MAIAFASNSGLGARPVVMRRTGSASGKHGWIVEMQSNFTDAGFISVSQGRRTYCVPLQKLTD
jgi:hypothetical protein